MTNFKGPGATIFSAMLVAVMACSAGDHSWERTRNGDELNSQVRLALENHPSSNKAIKLQFRLINSTGTSLKSIYLSPAASSGWEENLLGADELRDGDTINIQFNPNEKTLTWDMRVESMDGHYAEWKNLELDGVSEIWLVLKLASGTTAVAEVN